MHFNHSSQIIKMGGIRLYFILLLVSFSLNVMAQDNRAQLPSTMRNMYFEVNIGSINYPFSETHLEPGYTFESIHIPHTAVRLVLFGYDFNDALSARITYMRPVSWIRYNYTINGVEEPLSGSKTVWMNYGGLTLKYKYRFNEHFNMFAEGGYTIVTRHGFNDINGPVVKDAKISSYVIGGGLTYDFSNKLGLSISSIFSPKNTKEKQPSSTFIAAGLIFHLQPYTEQQLEEIANSGYIYPKQIIQFGYSNNTLGYGINNALEKVHLFWGGSVQVRQGFSINYQRNIFHAAKVFSMDWGVNFSVWQSDLNREEFFTLSVFPVLKFTFLHSKPADAYIYYSIAGPTYISKSVIDNKLTGENFTFQDNIGLGVFFGEKRNYNAEIKIGHYSNGNIFPGNPGIKIPLSFNLGYSF
ncbi:MAG: hypothetical protein CVU00_08380 [Bacteroidetes bacterium HGW-Bacteroidetes-17]|nr:MAG: hypothetical protein CVU00_08380 [Bacteroidetes bacterium HGW-Bacteroidetes-17]